MPGVNRAKQRAQTKASATLQAPPLVEYTAREVRIMEAVDQEIQNLVTYYNVRELEFIATFKSLQDARAGDIVHAPESRKIILAEHQLLRTNLYGPLNAHHARILPVFEYWGARKMERIEKERAANIARRRKFIAPATSLMVITTIVLATLVATAAATTVIARVTSIVVSIPPLIGEFWKIARSFFGNGQGVVEEFAATLDARVACVLAALSCVINAYTGYVVWVQRADISTPTSISASVTATN